MKFINDYEIGRDNNFNLLRVIAAFCVVFSHAFSVVGGETTLEPLETFTGYALGNHAVTVFFVISGFLITRSLLHSRNLLDYAIARALRLLPALFAASLLVVLVIGPMVTTLPLSEYLTSFRTWLDIPVSMLLFGDKMALPGVFETLPFPDIVNIPLWTLRWEVFAYVFIAGLFAVGILSIKTRFIWVLIAFGVAYFAVTLFTDWRTQLYGVDHILRFLTCFLTGSAMHVWRERIPLSFLIAAGMWALVWLSFSTVLYEPMLIFAAGYSALWFALVPGGRIRLFNKLGDYSYGIYIYGFPIKQTVMTFAPASSVLTLMAITTPILLALAASSYHFLERPALKARKPIAAMISRKIPTFAESPT